MPPSLPSTLAFLALGAPDFVVRVLVLLLAPDPFGLLHQVAPPAAAPVRCLVRSSDGERIRGQGGERAQQNEPPSS